MEIEPKCTQSKERLELSKKRDTKKNINQSLSKIHRITDEYESINQEEKNLDILEKQFCLQNQHNQDHQENTLLDKDLIPETQKLIEFYQDLIKRQENFYEQAFDVVEELENEEQLQRERIKNFQKQIQETENKIKQQKNQDAKSFVELNETINNIKERAAFKQILVQEEKQRILNYEKQLEKITQEYNQEKLKYLNLQQQAEKIEQGQADKKILSKKLTQEIEEKKKKQLERQKQTKAILEETRFLNNEIQNLKGNIRVYLRIKPLDMLCKSILEMNNTKNLYLNVPAKELKSENQTKQYKYKFEHIFNQDSTQENIFEELQDLMISVIDGYNVCIFAYGPTGTGKTFTMMGNGSFKQRGLAPRILEKIFQLVEQNESFGIQSRVFIELFEIYNDKIRDLSQNQDIQQEITTISQAHNLLTLAIDSRVVKKTSCNNESSRSHLIFKLTVSTQNKKNSQQRQGVLVLVDLAGSERLDQSKTVGESLNETLNINKSLTSLRDVISSLYQKKKHIPFRNSKLTMMLQDYLVGDSKTLMIVNLSSNEEDYQQTLSSLKFASQVKEVDNSNKLKKNRKKQLKINLKIIYQIQSQFWIYLNIIQKYFSSFINFINIFLFIFFIFNFFLYSSQTYCLFIQLRIDRKFFFFANIKFQTIIQILGLSKVQQMSFCQLKFLIIKYKF